MPLRWRIVRVALDPVLGHEQGGFRPALVVSNEDFNDATGLVTIVPLTTARRAARSWEVFLPAGTARLTNDSLLLPQQIRTVSQERIRTDRYGRIVDPGLRVAIARRVLEHLDFDSLRAVSEEAP